jgi:acylphosphatase
MISVSEMKHLKLNIRGKVQGVWYRKSTYEEATRLGLTGFVCNQPDGSVYAEAEGEEDILEEFVAWCKQGPMLASVTEVEIQEAALENFEAFSVKW